MYVVRVYRITLERRYHVNITVLSSTELACIFFGLLPLQVPVPRQFARVCHSVNMEWAVKENHVAVIALQNCGKSYSQIFELLKPLKISRMFIYRASKHYVELWRVEDRAQDA